MNPNSLAASLCFYPIMLYYLNALFIVCCTIVPEMELLGNLHTQHHGVLSHCFYDAAPICSPICSAGILTTSIART